jgi:hypothetical protein
VLVFRLIHFVPTTRHGKARSRIDDLKPTAGLGSRAEPISVPIVPIVPIASKDGEAYQQLDAIGTIGAFGSSLEEPAAPLFG